MSLAFGGKMGDRQLNLYKKEKRRANRSKVREALFISEYVFYKYFNAYQEAAEMYNKLNQIYPKKPDLRRTDQFRVWTHAFTDHPGARAGRKETKPRSYVFQSHQNIPIANCVDPNASFVVVTEHSESPQTEMTGHTESPEPESAPVKNGKMMELKIPLISLPTKTQEVPSIITETLETLTEEVIQEYTVDTIEPSLYEEISPEIVDKIISELRGDPGLKDVMTAVEEQIELEEVGMDIDIEIDDRLEAELENILW